MISFCASLCAFLMHGIDPQCQALIDANAQSLELVRTIQVEYIVKTLGHPERPPDRISWSRSGRQERIRRVAEVAGTSRDGRPLGISDELRDGQVLKWLANWDPANPQRITPSNQGTVQATVAPQTNMNAQGITPSANLLFEVDSTPRRTLSELARVARKVTCKGKVDVNGSELWLISLESPEETTPTTTKKYFDVYLDPLAGHMIRKVVVNVPKMILGNGQTMSYTASLEVVDFRDFGDGVFVPTKLRNSRREKLVSELQVESIKVNEPIEPHVFEMNWPRYVHIRHMPPVNGRVREEVWGDGKPIRDIVSSADARALEAELRKDPRIAAELGPVTGAAPPPPASTLATLAIVLGVLVAIMVALIIRRRIREQAT